MLDDHLNVKIGKHLILYQCGVLAQPPTHLLIQSNFMIVLDEFFDNIELYLKADFGFGNYFDPDGQLDTFCGSPPYAAPYHHKTQ